MVTTNARSAEVIHAELVQAGLPVLVRKKEFAELVRADERTIDRWVAAKRIAATRVAGSGSSRVLFRRSAIAQFLAQLEGGR